MDILEQVFQSYDLFSKNEYHFIYSIKGKYYLVKVCPEKHKVYHLAGFHYIIDPAKASLSIPENQKGYGYERLKKLVEKGTIRYCDLDSHIAKHNRSHVKSRIKIVSNINSQFVNGFTHIKIIHPKLIDTSKKLEYQLKEFEKIKDFKLELSCDNIEDKCKNIFLLDNGVELDFNQIFDSSYDCMDYIEMENRFFIRSCRMGNVKSNSAVKVIYSCFQNKETNEKFHIKNYLKGLDFLNGSEASEFILQKLKESRVNK